MSGTADLIDGALEATVVGSFTRVGYHARRRLFHWPPLGSFRMDGKQVVVTGATSGLGRWTAEQLARQGASVCIVGRDAERTERARSEIESATGAQVESELADLSLMAETAALADRFASKHDRLDALVLNAGVLTHPFTLTAEGNEVTFATHVLSQFLLTSRLTPLLQASASARVVITSSGGAYTMPLDVAALEQTAETYDGSKTYARCKRAQIALAGQWTQHLLGTGVTVNAMHPGWADTPGIRDALPGFSRLVGPLLRTPEEGADTIAWLASAPEPAELSGLFFLDRRQRPTHRLKRTRRPDEPEEAKRLWELCAERTAV